MTIGQLESYIAAGSAIFMMKLTKYRSIVGRHTSFATPLDTGGGGGDGRELEPFPSNKLIYSFFVSFHFSFTNKDHFTRYVERIFRNTDFITFV